MEQKKVVIFGAGPTGVRAVKKYKNLLNIVSVVDNNPSKWGTIIDEFEVVSPDKITILSPDIVIIASVQGKASICKQLIGMGLDSDRMFFDGGLQEDNRLSLYKQYSILLKNIPGSIAELGVFRGDTAVIMNEAFSDRLFYLFDTFEGFNSSDIKTEIQKEFSLAQAGEFADTNVDLVMTLMPHPEKCIPKKGWFPDSTTGILDKFSFVRLDVDLYEPTFAGLQWFGERLSSGGCMILDDYFNKNYAGVKAAVDEYCSMHHDKRILPFGVGFSAVLF